MWGYETLLCFVPTKFYSQSWVLRLYVNTKTNFNLIIYFEALYLYLDSAELITLNALRITKVHSQRIKSLKKDS